jgi:hypothetical protein
MVQVVGGSACQAFARPPVLQTIVVIAVIANKTRNVYPKC